MCVNSVEQLYFTYGICVGLGSAFAWTPTIAAMSQYFEKRRALANGLALGGAGIGSLFLPPLMQKTMDFYGYQGALLILAALMLHICLAAFLLRPQSTRGVHDGETKSYVGNGRAIVTTKNVHNVETKSSVQDGGEVVKNYQSVSGSFLGEYCNVCMITS